MCRSAGTLLLLSLTATLSSTGCSNCYSWSFDVDTVAVSPHEKVVLEITQFESTSTRSEWWARLLLDRDTTRTEVINQALPEHPLSARYTLKVDSALRRAWVVRARDGAAVMSAELDTGRTWGVAQPQPDWARGTPAGSRDGD
ncbi:MAG: hypothetical protein GX591_09675 [Planctomycetes bacterium]|nr:hypothetical protein [Planctomycetota bacterium]